jgi:hypothetical protein
MPAEQAVLGLMHVEIRSGKQWNRGRSSSIYSSQCGLALTLGLSADPAATLVEIDWPSGSVQKFRNIAASQFVVIDESSGLVTSENTRWQHI